MTDTRADTMNALSQDRYGPPDRIRLGRLPVPTPGPGQLLVRVRAASLNMYDVHVSSGKPSMLRLVMGLRGPKRPTPGADVAGVVEAVGPGVTRFGVGDEVFGGIGAGALAEYATGHERLFAAKPATVTFEQAAAIPMAGLTALQGLRDHGGVGPGQRVVVNGASGGVGTTAVQIAKALGAEVTAVCSSAKVDLVRSLGADHVIDYTVGDYTRLVGDQHVLFDNVGDRGWKETSRVLAPGGTQVAITGPKHGVLGPMREMLARKLASRRSDKRFVSYTAAVRAEDLQTLADMLESGAVVPVIERTYPLAGAVEALGYLAQGHARGKLVVVP